MEEAAAREYAAAREGSAVFDLADRSLLAVTGPRRVKFLHDILSNDVQGVRPGQGGIAMSSHNARSEASRAGDEPMSARCTITYR